MGLISLPVFILLAFLIVSSLTFLFLVSRVTELPLPHIIIKSSGGSARGLAIVLSGIGGWLDFDHRLAKNLAAARLDVIGIDCLRYFYQKKKSPKKLAQDLSDVVQSWSSDWLLEEKTLTSNQPDIVLVGYSKGADVLPFAVNLLQPELREQIQLVALLGVGRLATFKIQLSDMLGRGRNSLFPVQVTPEIRKLENIPGLCIYGDKDRVSLCRNLKRVPSMEVKEIKGGPVLHDAGSVADLILAKYFALSAMRLSQINQMETGQASPSVDSLEPIGPHMDTP